VAHGIAPLPMTLSSTEDHFCCLKSFSLLYLGNIARINYPMFTYESEGSRGL